MLRNKAIYEASGFVAENLDVRRRREIKVIGELKGHHGNEELLDFGSLKEAGERKVEANEIADFRSRENKSFDAIFSKVISREVEREVFKEVEEFDFFAKFEDGVFIETLIVFEIEGKMRQAHSLQSEQ